MNTPVSPIAGAAEVPRRHGLKTQQRVAVDITTVDDNPDLKLIRLTLGGDRSAFEVLYRRYVKKIYGLVFRMVGAQQEAEEVTQEVFYQVYKALPNFQGKSQFYTWIYRIATNVALQHVKKAVRKKKETSFEEALDGGTLPGFAGSGSPEKVAESRDFYVALEKAINSLPANQRLVMILGPIQGHSYEQMAHILGTSEEVIKGRLHRARENIREWLKHHR
jgi:RNA polymerase sigma factor (sigma-70 family)